MQETGVWSLDQEDPPEKGTATHSSVLAWRIPWTEESGGLQSMGSQRVGHNRASNTSHLDLKAFVAQARWGRKVLVGWFYSSSRDCCSGCQTSTARVLSQSPLRSMEKSLQRCTLSSTRSFQRLHISHQLTLSLYQFAGWSGWGSGCVCSGEAVAVAHPSRRSLLIPGFGPHWWPATSALRWVLEKWWTYNRFNSFIFLSWVPKKWHSFKRSTSLSQIFGL